MDLTPFNGVRADLLDLPRERPGEALIVLNEGHGFANPENRLDPYEKMEAFLARYLAADSAAPQPTK